MKRRGFIGLFATALLIFLRDVAHAICNPSLVRLLGQVRQLVQARPGRGPSLGHYFIQWYGHSSFLIHSGSQTKVVADPNFNVTPGIQADAVTVSNDHFHAQQHGSGYRQPDHLARHHLPADLESDTNQCERHNHRQYTEPARTKLGCNRQLHFYL